MNTEEESRFVAALIVSLRGKEGWRVVPIVDKYGEQWGLVKGDCEDTILLTNLCEPVLRNIVFIEKGYKLQITICGEKAFSYLSLEAQDAILSFAYPLQQELIAQERIKKHKTWLEKAKSIL